MTPSNFRRFKRPPASGYALLAILVMVTVLMFATLTTIPALQTQIRRNQENEMVHRGVQYTRAIKRYFAKFGRYPTSLDQLESTDNIRFLRKEFKDPMTSDGQWRLLHWGDVAMNLPGPGTPAAAVAAASKGSRTITQVEGQVVVWANPPGSATNSQGNSSGSPTSAFGGNGAVSGGITSNAPDASQSLTTDSTPIAGQMKAVNVGAIIGVVSNSVHDGLHAFNGKTQYSQWYFVYDPTLDNGALITRPYTGTRNYHDTGTAVQTPVSNVGQLSDGSATNSSDEQSEIPQ